MSQSLDAVGSTAIAHEGERIYELGRAPRAALELLHAESNPPVLTWNQAKKARGTDPFIVVHEGGFTIYKPWSSPGDTTLERALGGEFAVGPAVVGRLVPAPHGSRLELRVKNYAPAPAQRLTVGVGAVSWAFFVVAPLLFAGPHPVALGLSAIMLVGGLASLVWHRRRRRSQDIRDLLAIVERTFGPLELSSAPDDPHRRDDDSSD